MRAIWKMLGYLLIIGGCIDKKQPPSIITSRDTNLRIIHIERVRKEIDRSGLSAISDSMRWMAYHTFFDQVIRPQPYSEKYLSFYDLEPLFFDQADNYFVIRYELLSSNYQIPETADSHMFLDIQYRGRNSVSFSKDSVKFLGISYQSEKKVSADSIKAFYVQNAKFMNGWYKVELRKRGLTN